MVRAAARRVDAATRHAFDDFGVGHVDLKHEVERDAGFEERFGLRNRAGEAVEEEAVLAVGLSETFLDETDNDVVGNELALIHHGLGGKPERGAGLDGGAQHVPRGNLRNAELFADELRLGALAGAGGADENKTHGITPS